MVSDTSPQVTVRPRSAPWIDDAVTAGGGSLCDPADATAVVWTHPADPDGLEALLAEHPAIDWVQLPWAGVEPYRHLVDGDRRWSCAKEVYGPPVAEHAFALLLAGFRQLHRYARATSWTKGEGRNLTGARITILGGGGIARSFIELVAPFEPVITVVRQRPEPLDGVDRVVGTDGLHDALRGADALVLALPLVDATRGIIGAEELALLAPGAWVVNVARGEHVDTDALLAALESGHLGGAGLDVTDPEPLPDGHPLWAHPDVIITPHTANTAAMAEPLLHARIRANVAAYRDGRPLEGPIDPDLGY